METVNWKVRWDGLLQLCVDDPAIPRKERTAGCESEFGRWGCQLYTQWQS